IKKTNDKNWMNLFDEVRENDIPNWNLRNQFYNHYMIELREGTGAAFPVPFHADIACYYRPHFKKSGRPMDNKGFSNKFLLLFFSKDGGINYDLIRDFWDTLKSKKGLNYLERYILEKINSQHNEEFRLRSKEVLESKIDIDIDKFRCRYQIDLFQNDLRFVLDLNLSRVDKINWIQNLIYFHFSTYMLRSYKLIKEEEINFNDSNDICLKCEGLHTCPYKGLVNTQSNISGNTNRETKEIQQHYTVISNDIFLKGYYRFIAFNQLRDTYQQITSNEAKNLNEISQLFNNNPARFSDAIKSKLSQESYSLNEYLDIESYFDNFNTNSDNIFSLVTQIYKDYYEKKGSRSPNSATIQVYNKLAGDKMGCKYLRIQRRRNAVNFYLLKSDFLTFITNIIVRDKNQILLEDYWDEMKERGFTYASQREKRNIEEQLSLLGHLERKSDAGESLFVTKTVEEAK
ncbi:MAG: DNA phosphorothioation-dependent restriction protein DptG, partial [bacterium]